MKRRDFLGTAAMALLASRLPAGDIAKYKLGVITDEVSPDLEHDLQWLQHYGLSWAELRGVWGKPITDADPDTVKRAKDLLAKYNVKVSVIDTPYYKITLPGTEAVRREGTKDGATLDDQKALLERAMARAKDFGTDRIRIFSFWRVQEPKAVFDRVARLLEDTAAIAKKENIRLVLENEYSCNVATGAESGELLNAVKSPALGINWDPGNAYFAGEFTPYPDGYKAMDKKRIWHCHLKDAVRDEQGKNHWLPVGAGKIDFVGQFRALLADGYRDTLSLETHYQNAAKNKETSSDESMVGILDAIKKV